MSLTWNEFRSAHKGVAKSEISKLWKSYKAGEYEFPAKEEPETTVTEVAVEEPTSVEETPVKKETPIADLCAEYIRLMRRMEMLGPRLTDEVRKGRKRQTS